MVRHSVAAGQGYTIDGRAMFFMSNDQEVFTPILDHDLPAEDAAREISLQFYRGVGT